MHVLGGGSLGSLFASHFAKATVPTTLLLRPEAARLAGPNCTISVTAEDSVGVDRQTLPCEPADGTVKQPFDILVVAVKAFDARPALEAVGTRVASSSTVILMCNGALAVADDLAHVLGDASLLCATTTHGAWSRGPQDLHHAGRGGHVDRRTAQGRHGRVGRRHWARTFRGQRARQHMRAASLGTRGGRARAVRQPWSRRAGGGPGGY